MDLIFGANSILEKNYNRISCIHPHTHMVRALGVKGTLQFLIIMHKSSELKIKHWIFFYFYSAPHNVCTYTCFHFPLNKCNSPVN